MNLVDALKKLRTAVQVSDGSAVFVLSNDPAFVNDGYSVEALMTIKDELKDILKIAKKFASENSARRFKLLDWAAKNTYLHSDDDMLTTKGRRMVSREISNFLSSGDERQKFENSGKPESMDKLYLLQLTIKKMLHSMCNNSSTNEAYVAEFSHIGAIADRWEEKVFDYSGKLAIRQVRDILEAEAFTDKHNPHYPVITKSL